MRVLDGAACAGLAACVRVCCAVNRRTNSLHRLVVVRSSRVGGRGGGGVELEDASFKLHGGMLADRRHERARWPVCMNSCKSMLKRMDDHSPTTHGAYSRPVVRCHGILVVLCVVKGRREGTCGDGLALRRGHVRVRVCVTTQSAAATTTSTPTAASAVLGRPEAVPQQHAAHRGGLGIGATCTTVHLSTQGSHVRCCGCESIK